MTTNNRSEPRLNNVIMPFLARVRNRNNNWWMRRFGASLSRNRLNWYGLRSSDAGVAPGKSYVMGECHIGPMRIPNFEFFLSNPFFSRGDGGIGLFGNCCAFTMNASPRINCFWIHFSWLERRHSSNRFAAESNSRIIIRIIFLHQTLMMINRRRVVHHLLFQATLGPHFLSKEMNSLSHRTPRRHRLKSLHV